MRYLPSLMFVLFVTACSLTGASSQAGWFLGAEEKGDMRPFEKPLPVNTEHKKLAIGYSVAVGVKEDGTVWSWGSTNEGELGDGQQYSKRYVPGRIEGMTDFIEVAGNGSHFLALRKDGTVWSWGDNEYGQLGYKTEKRFSVLPQQIPKLKSIVSIASALGHSLALDNQGKVWAFGSNNNMQLAISPKDDAPHCEPKVVFSDGNAVKVLAYAGTSGVLTSQGNLFYWGADIFLQNRMLMILPKKYDAPAPLVDVAISDAIYVLTNDGYVWAQNGSNRKGQLGQGDFNNYTTPVKVKNIGRIVQVAAKGSSAIALDETGKIWQWGNSVRFPSIPTVKVNIEPLPVLVAKLPNTFSLVSNSANSALQNDGKVYFWGIDEGRRGTSKPKFDQTTERDWFVPQLSLWSWK